MDQDDDPDLALFREIEQRYPGSKKIISEEREKREARKTEPDLTDEAQLWVDNTYYKREKLVGGKRVTFYTLAALAEAMHRAPNTLREWEAHGKFPKTPFRTAANGARGGKRLYTREQIEGARAIAEEEGLLYSQRSLTPRFTQRVTDLFNKIRTDIKKGN